MGIPKSSSIVWISFTGPPVLNAELMRPSARDPAIGTYRSRGKDRRSARSSLGSRRRIMMVSVRFPPSSRSLTESPSGRSSASSTPTMRKFWTSVGPVASSRSTPGGMTVRVRSATRSLE